MAAGTEVDAAEQFIFNALSGDATLTAMIGGVFNTEAPQSVAFPFVIYQNMSAVDYAAVGANRIWTNQVFMVKVVGDTADYSTLSPAVARIDVLLHRGSGTALAGIVWAAVREQVIRQPESVSGKPYRHSGALYRLYAS